MAEEAKEIKKNKTAEPTSAKTTAGKKARMANKKQKKVSKSKQSETPFENELKSIYEEKKGFMPDMTKLDYRRRSRVGRFLTFLLIILGIAAIAAWAGFLFYSGKPSFSGDQVKVDVTAPFSVRSGETIIYRISLTNNESVTLEDGEVEAVLPDGFIFTESNLEVSEMPSSQIRGQNRYRWDISPLHSGQTRNIEMVGRLVGEENFLSNINITFSYSPNNYSSRFEKSATFTSEISGTIAQLTAQYKNQVTNEEPVNIDIFVKNIHEEVPFDNLKLVFEIPESFTVDEVLSSVENKMSADGDEETEESETEDSQAEGEEEFIPMSEVEQDQFEQSREILIQSLSADQRNGFRLSGSFNVEENTTQNIVVSVFAQDGRGDYNLQLSETLEFQIVRGELLATLIVAGSETGSPINFGQEVSFLLTIANKSETALGDVNVRMVVDSQVLDWETLNDPQEGTLGTNQILWTKDDISALRLMLPEDEVQISFSLEAKPYDKVSSLSPSNLRIQSFAEATINSIDGLNVVSIIDSNSIVNEFNSNARLTSQSRYFNEEGDTVGSGPIPPQVGEKTTYEILWKIDNSLHELNELRVSATLPDNVNWEQTLQAEAGNMRLEGNEVVWEINRMPTSVSVLQATFKVSITPEQSDVNKILTLLNETTLRATDQHTDGQIEQTSTPATTNVSGSESGLVQGRD